MSFIVEFQMINGVEVDKLLMLLKIPPGPYCMESLSYSDLGSALGEQWAHDCPVPHTKHHHFQHCSQQSRNANFATSMGNWRISGEKLYLELV